MFTYIPTQSLPLHLWVFHHLSLFVHETCHSEHLYMLENNYKIPVSNINNTDKWLHVDLFHMKCKDISFYTILFRLDFDYSLVNLNCTPFNIQHKSALVNFICVHVNCDCDSIVWYSNWVEWLDILQYNIIQPKRQFLL